MQKIVALLTIVLILPLVLRPQSADKRAECIQSCIASRVDTDVERQEIVALEREAVHAIQLGDATFFRRTYSDDFRGTLSHGEPVDKAQFIHLVQSSQTNESFAVSDIKVRIYRETAVATCLWSTRSALKHQLVQGQIRVIHVYVNGPTGWKLVSGQHTVSEIEVPDLWTAKAVSVAISSF